MYVCLCHAITDSQIEAAVRQGDVSLSDLKKRLGVGSQCGKCTRMASQIIERELDSVPNFYEVA